ncbi:nitroreductase family protein [Rhodococcus sp. NPDC060086]|uniref:nitroreductase family protein n=1 Tax=Rhodococcus sp. NPDC060086 TaxID=3347055 RepID=UPI00365D5E50
MTVDSETWSHSDTEIIARAVIEAPSVHDTQPWNLRLPGSAAELDERLEFADPGADPLRPDRLISCGTAVAHLELAMRVLGRQTRTDLCPDPGRPALVARIETRGSAVPTSSDLRLYAAISHRKSHRDAFADIPVPAETIGDVVSAGARVPGVGIRLLASDEAPALADMLTYSAEAKRRNPHYQREMFSWMSHWQPDGNSEVVEHWDATLDENGAAGKALITSDVPDPSALADAIDRETVLLFNAASADPIDLVRIGMATERAWLAAVDARLSASVLTHPLRIEDSADRLGARLGMATPPQLIMRIGF